MEEAISDYDRAAGRFDPAGVADSGADTHDREPSPERRQLGSLLTEGGFLTDAQLGEALAEGEATGGRLGEVVVSRGWASEDDVAKLLAQQWELGYVERASIFFDAEALARLSREQAQQLEALPTRVQDGRVVVAVAEPTEQRLEALREIIGADTVVVVVPKSALDAGLRSDLLSGSRNGTNDPRDAKALEPDLLDEVVVISRPAAPPAAPDEPVEPLPAASRPEPAGTQPNPDEAPELSGVLVALEAVGGEATALEQRMSELARRLARIVEDLASATARLEQSGAHDDREARIRQLEEQLTQRTEMTDNLRAQLLGLTRTLEDYR